MYSLLAAITLAAGLNVPATTGTPTSCEIDYNSAGNGASSLCIGGSGYQHRIRGICYNTGPIDPHGVNEYPVTGPWANPGSRSSVLCKRFWVLIADYELRPTA